MTSVEVPAVGRVPRVWVYGSLGGAAAYVAWRYHKASAAKAAAVLSVDPITGLPVDAASGLELTPSGSTSDAYSVPGGGTYYQGGTSYSGPTIPQNNLQWSQNAASYLTGIGYDGPTVAAALGAYLARATLSGEQTTIVQAAVAAVGPPPYGGPYGTVPSPGAAPAPVSNLVVTERAPHQISLMWNASVTPGVIKYHVAERSPIGASDQDTTATMYTKQGLVINTSHTFTVTAIGPNNQVSPGVAVNASTLAEGQAPVHTSAPAA
jgi:hypothetical protein